MDSVLASVFHSASFLQAWNAGHALAVTSVTGEQSQRYREELEQLIKARMKPGERALPELRSSPAVRPRPSTQTTRPENMCLHLLYCFSATDYEVDLAHQPKM